MAPKPTSPNLDNKGKKKETRNKAKTATGEGTTRITSTNPSPPTTPTRDNQKGPGKAEFIFVFAITVFIPNAAYIIYNMPQLFEDVMIHKFQIQPVHFEAMYTAYSAPNFIAVPLGSLALSYTGLGLGAAIYNGIVYFGLVIMQAGFYLENYTIVLLGRAVFGIGAHTLFCAAPAIYGKWFMGKALSISQAVNRAFINAGISLSVIIGPGLFVESRSMGPVFMFYGLATFACFAFTAIYAIFEHFYEHRSQIIISDIEGVAPAAPVQDQVSRNSQRRLEHGEVDDMVRESHLAIDVEQKFDLEEKDKIFKFEDLRSLSATYWILALIFAVGTSIYLMFNTFATDFFMNRFAYSYLEATKMFAIFQTSSIFMIPAMSFLTTRFGCKGYLLLFSVAVGAVTFFTFTVLPAEPNKPLHIALLLSYAFFASLLIGLIYPCISLSVPTRAATMAFGMACTIQNVLIAVLPLYFGAINKDRSVASYNLSMYSLIIMCAVTGLLSIWVSVHDIRSGGKLLHLPENSDKVAELRRLIEEGYYTFKAKKKATALSSRQSSAGLGGGLTVSDQTGMVKRDSSLGEALNGEGRQKKTNF